MHAITQARKRGHSDIVSLLAAGGAALNPCSDEEKIHSDTTEQLQMSKSITVTRYRGGGSMLPDYTLVFRDFNTFVADVKLCCGCFYFEVEIISMETSSDHDFDDYVQFGCCTEGFEMKPVDQYNVEGVGDDASSWAVDGCRQMKWHLGDQEAFTSRWTSGDTIGFMLDMRVAGAAVMSINVNGNSDAPNGVAFTGIDAPYLCPALTGYGRFRLNFGDRPFAHKPSDINFTSVHAFHLRGL